MHKLNKDFRVSKFHDELPNVVHFEAAYYPFHSRIGKAINSYHVQRSEIMWGKEPDHEDFVKSIMKVAEEMEKYTYREMYYRDLCLFRIFDQTYWGNFPVTNSQDITIYDIAANRDEFCTINNLEKAIPKKNYPDLKVFDHLELYKDSEGCVHIVASLYCDTDMHRYGMKLIEPIYSFECATWHRKFDNMKEYKNFCKAYK
jgi:hypothetical protein